MQPKRFIYMLAITAMAFTVAAPPADAGRHHHHYFGCDLAIGLTAAAVGSALFYNAWYPGYACGYGYAPFYVPYAYPPQPVYRYDTGATDTTEQRVIRRTWVPPTYCRERADGHYYTQTHWEAGHYDAQGRWVPGRYVQYEKQWVEGGWVDLLETPGHWVEEGAETP